MKPPITLILAICALLLLIQAPGCKPSKEQAQQVHMQEVKNEAQRSVKRPSNIVAGTASPLELNRRLADPFRFKETIQSAIATAPNATQQRTSETKLNQVDRQIANETLQTRSGRIVNGSIATLGQLPYHVGLLYTGPQNPYNLYFCGGALIGLNWVVTAAHCLTRYLKYPDVQIFV